MKNKILPLTPLIRSFGKGFEQLPPKVFAIAITPVAVSLLLFAGVARADSGPLFEPLEIQYVYMVNAPWIFVQFSDGSMPGCHSDKGGMLYPGNPNYDQIYAQILTMSTTGGMRGKVVYDIIDPTADGWDDCTIQGLALYPAG